MGMTVFQENLICKNKGSWIWFSGLPSPATENLIGANILFLERLSLMILHRILGTSSILWTNLRRLHSWFTHLYKASQIVLVVKNPPANAGGLRDLSLMPGSRRGGGVEVEEKMATLSSILALMLGKIEHRRRRRRQRMRRLDSVNDSMGMNLSKLWDSGAQRILACYSPWGCKEWDAT